MEKLIVVGIFSLIVAVVGTYWIYPEAVQALHNSANQR
jgi:hypothetical protein